MTDLTLPPLPNPPCGATAQDGQACQNDATVVVASEWPTGYAMAVWRCHDHAGASVEATLRYSTEAVITVTPLAIADQAAQPTPEPPVTAERSPRLIR
jgi:hypothetical protein